MSYGRVSTRRDAVLLCNSSVTLSIHAVTIHLHCPAESCSQTSDRPVECKIERSLRLQGGMKNDESMAVVGSTEERQVKRRTSEPCIDTNGTEEVKLSDVTAKIESASKRSDERVEAMMQRMEYMVTQTSEPVMKLVGNQINDVNSTVKELRKDREVKFGKMDERFTKIEARINRLENHENRMNETTTNVAAESLRLQDVQNDRKAVATGFRDDSTEEEIEELLTYTIVAAGMSQERIKIKCPAKPISHAFGQ